MRAIVGVALGLAGIVLAGCASVSYLTKEYGRESPTATIMLPDGRGFWIFAHKTKARLLVSVDLPTASGMGFVSGLTYGAISNAPVPREFAGVAQQWLDESRPGCKAVNGQRIETVYVEYDIECGTPNLSARPR